MRFRIWGMHHVPERLGGMVLIYAICLHIAWGIVMLVSRYPLRITPLRYVLLSFGQGWGGVALIAAAAAASYGLVRPGWKGLIASLPQNALLFVAALGGLVAALSGHYADGVPRPQGFIFADQLAMMLIAPLHAWSLAIYHGRSWTRS